jgi:Ca2+-transporting ATPase
MRRRCARTGLVRSSRTSPSSVGIYGKFVQTLEDNQARTNAGEQSGVKEDESEVKRKHTNDFSIDQSQLNSVLSGALRKLFNEAIAVYSTAFEDTDTVTGQREFVGSKTETAVLQFAKELGWADYQKTHEEAEIVQMIPFSSERKAMGAVVKLPNGKWRLYLKGASETLTKKCCEACRDRSSLGEG